MIPVTYAKQRERLEAVQSLILSEVNVKELKFVENDRAILVKKVKCNFKKMGPKFGAQMGAVAAAVAGLTQDAIAELETNGSYTLALPTGEAVVEVDDVEIVSEDITGWLDENEGKLDEDQDGEVKEEKREEGEKERKKKKKNEKKK